MKNLIVRSQAQLDVEEAAIWYENQRSGLGAQFLNEVDYVVKRIRVDPLQFPEIDPTVRRGLTNRFPYSVYFSTTKESIEIVAILHQHRHPDTWRERL